MSDGLSGPNLIGVILRLLQDGELEQAVELYEERGRAVAEQLFARLAARPLELDAGVRMYEQARDFTRGARLREQLKQWPDAARLWELAGDAAAAARAWRRAGDQEKAAELLEASGQHDEAAQLYGQPGRRAAALASGGHWMASAAEYRAAGNKRAEADALRAVPLEHPERVVAVKRLPEILLERNRSTEAAQLLAEAIRDNEQGRSDAELHEMLAFLFDKANQGAQAERLRARAQRLRGRAAIQEERAARKPKWADTDPEAAEEAHGAGWVDPDADTSPKSRAPRPRDDYRSLKSLPIFARLPMEEMRALYRMTIEQHWQPGEQIVEVGVDAPGLIVLLEGDAEVYALTADGPRHLNSVGPGAHLGEISLLSNSLTSARVTATTFVRGLHLSREAFEEFVALHPGGAATIYRLFSEKLAERVRALSLS